MESKVAAKRTEADQGSEREGVYTMLQSEQFMWMYYQRHPLCCADSDFNKFRKRKVVKKLIKTAWRRKDGIQISPESEKMTELVPTKLKKKAGRCIVMEPEAVSKTNNALLKAVLKAHLWKRQLEKGKHAEVRELSTIVNISMRYIQQIIRLNYSAPKIVEDIVNGKKTISLWLVDLREIPMLWSEQLEKFCRLASSITHICFFLTLLVPMCSMTNIKYIRSSNTSTTFYKVSTGYMFRPTWVIIRPYI
jgi:hypothetical protein